MKIIKITLLLTLIISSSAGAQAWEEIYHENFGEGWTGQPLPNGWSEYVWHGTVLGATGANNDPCRASLLGLSDAYLAYQMTLSDTYEYYVSMNLKTADPVGVQLIFYHNTTAQASGTQIGNLVDVPIIPDNQAGQVISSASFSGLNGTHYFIIGKSPTDPSSGNERVRVDDFRLYRRPLGGINSPPSVSFSTPLDGDDIAANTDIFISANASDSDGTVASVKFYEGTTLIHEDTSAPFETTLSGGLGIGNYTLKAVATDDDGSTSQTQISITVNSAVVVTDSMTVCSRIDRGSDDAEENGNNGQMLVDGNLLDLVNGQVGGETSDQLVGLRFNNLNIPQGATISSAHIQFTAYDTNNIGSDELTIHGESSDNPATFSNLSGSISSRSLTTASVGWSPADWTVAGEAGPLQKTVDIAPIIQELVNRPGFSESSSIAIIITGSGRRAAKSYNNSSSEAPELCIVYGTTPPSVAWVTPTEGSVFTEGENIALQATATDSDGTIQSVEFYYDDTLIYNDPTAPYTATISGGLTAGSYVLKAVATDDDGATKEDQISITVQAPNGGGSPSTICSTIAAGSHDAEERSNGNVKRGQSNLDIVDDANNGNQLIGLRFLNLNIPQGATITEAYIQFAAVDSDNQDPCQLNIYAEAHDDAPNFLNQDYNISNRTLTNTSVSWSPSTWNGGDRGDDQKTVNIASVIQEVVNRPGFTENSAIALIINGSGRRKAVAYNLFPTNAPQLCVTYQEACTDSDQDGHCVDIDCDDNDASVYPGATEVCDGKDNNCDGQIDEDVTIAGLSVIVNDACEGQSNGAITLQLPTDSISYTLAWDNDSTGLQIDSLVAGDYCVTISGSQGCVLNQCYTVGTKICKEITGSPMNVLAQSDGTVIRVRWVINDFDIWRLANQNGYTIRRTVYARDSVALSIGEQVENSVVLAENWKPLVNGSWVSQFPGDDRAIAAEQILYSNEWDIEVTGSPTFADAVQNQQMNENRLFFAHFLADQEFTIAEAMALGYEDDTALPGEEYVYTIIINQTTTENGRLAGSSFGDLGNQGEELIAPSGLSVEGLDKKIVIGWNMEDLDEQYTSFDIFRSADGQTFVQANTAPFIFGTDDQADARRAYFADSLGNNGTYFYQVVGRTPFGISGPASATIEGTARPARMNLQLFIDSLSLDTAYAWLGWEGLATAYADSLQGFNLYRSTDIDGPYDLLTTSSINSTERHYQDDNPLLSAYYILEAVDQYGHPYQSPPKFVQLPDLSPPVHPQGISGIDEEGVITLDWQANTEEDLEGYRVYRSFVRHGQYVLISDGTIPENTYQDDLQESVLTDSIYYRLQASDVRSNYSVYSPIIAVKRVDITPPALPVLYKATPTPAGIALAWRYSSSEDVAYHELQRKPKGSPGWEAVLQIANEERDQYVVEDTAQITGVCYLDESELQRREYEYQLVAFDEAGLAAGSEIIAVRPYDSGQRGSIENFQIQPSCDWVNANSLIDLALKDKMEQVKAEYESTSTIDVALRNSTIMGLEMVGIIESSEMSTWQAYTDIQFYNEIDILYTDYEAGATTQVCTIDLSWSYQMEPSVSGFQIHRSRRGSRMKLYKTLPIDFFFEDGTPSTGNVSFSYSDEEVETDIRYVYKIMAVHSDGGYSEVSRPLTLVVQP